MGMLSPIMEDQVGEENGNGTATVNSQSFTGYEPSALITSIEVPYVIPCIAPFRSLEWII